MGNIKITPEEAEKEFTFSCIIDRYHTSPNEINRASLYNALKEAFVYIPARIEMNPEVEALMIENLKKGIATPPSNDMRVAPMLMKNNVGQRIMPWFSREEEMKNTAKKVHIMKMPATQAIRLADQMPDAFDIMLDLHTHPVRLTIDEIIEGLQRVSGGKDSIRE